MNKMLAAPISYDDPCAPLPLLPPACRVNGDVRQLHHRAATGHRHGATADDSGDGEDCEGGTMSTMKLSEAIRLGEFALKPINGRWIQYDTNGKPCGGCAVGRAMYAAGYQEVSERLSPMHEFAKEKWAWIRSNDFDAPCGCIGENNNILLGVISHLYEFHDWSMTQLAEYIESIEPQEQAESDPNMLNVAATNGPAATVDHRPFDGATSPPLVEAMQ